MLGRCQTAEPVSHRRLAMHRCIRPLVSARNHPSLRRPAPRSQPPVPHILSPPTPPTSIYLVQTDACLHRRRQAPPLRLYACPSRRVLCTSDRFNCTPPWSLAIMAHPEAIGSCIGSCISASAKRQHQIYSISKSVYRRGKPCQGCP
jgi:hypothetical protein